MKKAIILANGDAPLKSQINYLRKIGYSKLVCADGGANTAKILNIVPDIIIGDLDSISKENLDYFEKRTKIIQYKRQNDTDVEKSLKYLLNNGFNQVVLLGATGNRLDHTICNLGIVIKYFNKIKISILHGNSFLRPYNRETELSTVKGETISVYGFDTKTKIKSTGLKFPLKNISLPFGEKESTSNAAVKTKVKLEIKGGVIFVIRDFKIMRDNDFI